MDKKVVSQKRLEIEWIRIAKSMNPDRIFALIGWKQARDQNSAN